MEEKKIININVIEIGKLLIVDKRHLLIYACVAGVIGVLLAFATPKVYKSTVILAPEESGNGFSGSISSIAALVGMDLKIGQTGDALYPEIYPELMSSSKFIVELFPVKVTPQESNESFTYQEYIEDHQKTAFYKYPIKLYVYILEKINGDGKGAGQKPNPYHLTKKEDKTARIIKEKIKCTVDKKTNVITIIVEDQDPQIAATIADSVQVHLQHAITDYRTKKARVDLEYMEKLYDEANSQYEKARQKYASFGDANSRIALKAVQSKLDELENDLQLKYNIYQHVVEQLQLAKAKVQERTPAFTIIQGACVPVRHSGLSKIVILIIWMILGFMVRCGVLAWRNHEKFINLNS